MAVKVEEIKKQSVHTYEEVATDLKVIAKENNIETFDIVPMTFVHPQTKQTIPIGNYLPMYNFQVKKVFEM